MNGTNARGYGMAVINETEVQTRLRRAKESLAIAREKEIDARKAFNDAAESVKRAKERYEELFMAEEMAEVARRKSDYRHETK